MPLIDLSDVELTDAAQAARAAAYRAEQDAVQATPSVKVIFESSRKRYRMLAEKFDGARLSTRADTAS